MIFSLVKDIKNLKIYLIISDQIQFKIFMHAKVAVSDQYSIAKFLQQMQSELLLKTLQTFIRKNDSYNLGWFVAMTVRYDIWI